MKRNLLNYSIFLHLFLWVGLLQPDGFAERTLVRGEYGFKPIERFVVGNHVVVIADGGQLQQHSVTHTMSYVADYFIKIQIKDICVCAAPDQKFYSCTRNDWISASELKVSEQLLCGSGKTVGVDAIEMVHKQQKMHAFSVETSHIFCVTPYEIIAHNIEPVSASATAILSVTCPPAGIAVAVGQAVAFGVLACVMYCKHRRDYKNQIKHGCSRNSSTVPPTDCLYPVVDVPVVCDIKVGQPDRPAMMVNKIPESDFPTMLVNEIPEIVVDNNCEFPIYTERLVLHKDATKQGDSEEKKRYDGPEYNRTEDWAKEFKKKDKLERSIYVNQGKRALELLEDIEGCNGFKKGDFVVVDALHKDHLEVFGKNLEWKQVANFDGTKNEKKTEQGAKEKRQPLKKG